MLRRFSYLAAMACLVAMTAYFGIRSNHAADPAPEKKPAAPKTPPAAANETEADPFAVPEGTDDKALMMFLQRIVRTPPDDANPAGIVAHLNKIDSAINEILSREISDELYQAVAELRLQLYGALPQFGDKTAEAKKAAFIKVLSESPRAGMKKLVKRIEFQERVQSLAEADEAAQQAFIDDVVAMILAAPKGDDEELQMGVQLAMASGQMLERSNSPLAVPAYKKFIEAIKSKGDDRLNDLVSSMEGTMRRLDLPGHPIEISGTTLAGKPFDIKDYKGKVVIVDFWATWCGPCLAELPHLQEVYKAYHPKGLEIVGISLDNEKEDLEKFVAEKNLPWVTLFESGEGDSGWQNKIASFYGISGIPTMILVNAEGNVVTVQVGGFGGDAGGTTLQAELEKLLGPAEIAGADEPAASVKIKNPAAGK